MAATIPRITVSNEWQSANSLTGIAAGSALKIQHTGGSFVDIILAASQPAVEDQSSGEQMRVNEWYAVAAGEAEVWVKTSSPSDGMTARLSVQENA